LEAKEGDKMKNFRRDNILFSLCGLNCGLCAMHLGNHCPGCGGGEHHSCAIARCSFEHDSIKYCFQCTEYPCPKYENIDNYDSFITHRNQLKDIQKAKEIGIDAYTKEQVEKVEILNCLLEKYNAGRQKSFFCLAVNLLDIKDIRAIMKHLTSNSEVNYLPIKDRAAYAVSQFQGIADKQGIQLKLHKKPTAKK